jgi:dipeptidyl aminopeptidase/acylaminoacyl peptidase
VGAATAFSPQPPRPSAANPPPDTDVYLASLSTDGDTIEVERPENITKSPGYDNQPSFTPDGRAVLFTSNRGGKQTDIYRYEIATHQTTRVISTPESEYSPVVAPDRQHISVIRVEPDQTQRLWWFTLDGKNPEPVLKDVKPAGYYAWLDGGAIGVYVLGQPSTLQIVDRVTGHADIVARDIGRSIQHIPGTSAVSFVQREPKSGGAGVLKINAFDMKMRQTTELVDAVAGATEADTAWIPNGTLLMASKDTLYSWKLGRRDWFSVADLGAMGLHHVSRIAVSPKGDRVAMVGDDSKK